MKNLKRIALAFLAATLLITSAGCGKKEETTAINKGSGEMPETLSVYCSIGTYTRKAGAEDLNDTLYFQLMEELTGCHVNWIHPAAGASEEKFNLTIASGNLPDLMVYSWDIVPGGAQSYAEDEIILPLRDLIEENMPNLSKYMKENPDIAKQFTSDDGEIYYIPFIRKDEELKIFKGPQIRQDWLDKLGLEMPTDPESLYDVLKAFKTQDPNGNGKNDEIPLSGIALSGYEQSIGNFMWQFGTTNGFYVENGEVKFGVLEDSFEEALKYITKLYSEGLIDPDYLLNDRSKMDNKFMNDQVGVVYSLQPGRYYENMNDGVKKVAGIPHLSAKGVENTVFDASYVQDITSTSIAVTTSNKNPAGSLKWLDSFFGDKGLEYMNFGKEGVTFEWVDGYPKLTDYILNNPDGKSLQEIACLSLGAYQSNFPTLQDWRYYEQILTPWGKEAIETWSASAKTAGVLPALSFTDEENRTIAQNMSQIDTFVSEKLNKIVIGNSSFDELSGIRERVKKMGIEEIIEIYNNALKRYNSR